MFNQNQWFSNPRYYNNQPQLSNWRSNYNTPYTMPNYNINLKKSGINWNNLLNNTQRTLNIVNQAIPVFYQFKPIWKNAKTLMRVYNEFNKASPPAPPSPNNTPPTDNSPQFFA